MIALVDYDLGNLRSVEKALETVGTDVQLTSDPDVILAAGEGRCCRAWAPLADGRGHIIPPDAQRARASNATATEVAGSHVVYTQPAAVADEIAAAAKGK